MMKAYNTERDLIICDLFKKGTTITRLAIRFGVSRQRIQQIISDNGLTRHDGGYSVIKQTKDQIKKIEKKRQIFIKESILGMPMEKYKHLLKYRPRPYYVYLRQRLNALQRGIEWSLSFGQWWMFWEDSGQWENHGRGFNKFVLTRKNYKKGFHLDNVEIAVFSEYLRNPTIDRTKRYGTKRNDINGCDDANQYSD